jgi:glycosyltransferase involved in cell wall biosynthesis
MAEQGAEIDVLTYGSGQDVDIPGVRLVRIPRLRWLEPVRVGPSWPKLVLDMFMTVWTIGLLTKNRYQVVHAHEESVFWCRLLKPIFGFRLVYDMHSSLPQQLENFKFTTSRFLIGTFKALEERCLEAASAVITICPDLRDYALKSGVSPDRHLMIENSIFDDVRVRAPAEAHLAIEAHKPVTFGPGHPVILYAGTFEVYQGIEILIEAFAHVVRQRPEARLLLVGGTPDQVRADRASPEERRHQLHPVGAGARLATPVRDQHAAQDLRAARERAAAGGNPDRVAHPGARRFGVLPRRAEPVIARCGAGDRAER